MPSAWVSWPWHCVLRAASCQLPINSGSGICSLARIKMKLFELQAWRCNYQTQFRFLLLTISFNNSLFGTTFYFDVTLCNDIQMFCGILFISCDIIYDVFSIIPISRIFYQLYMYVVDPADTGLYLMSASLLKLAWWSSRQPGFH